MTADLLRCADFTEPDELLHAVPDVMLCAMPVGSGHFSASLLTLRFDEMVFQVGTCSPAVIMAQAARGSSVVQMPYAGTESFILNGRPLTPGLFGLYGGGGTLERVSQQRTAHCALILPMEKVESLLDIPSASPLLRLGGQGLVQARQQDWQDAVRIFDLIQQVARAHANTILHPETRRSVRASLLRAIQRVVRSNEQIGAPRPVRGSPARRRIVNAVDDYLRVNPSRPIYTEDLCNVLDISPAWLAEAFRTSFGITPHRFLKLRRLTMVRTALRDREGTAPLVGAVAQEHGFWHLGQFARDYRAMYGETPSETLARARL